MEQHNQQMPPIPKEQPKKKMGCMKMALIAFGAFFVVFVLIGIFTDKEIDKVAEADEQIAKEIPQLSQEQQDSIETANQEKIARLAPLFEVSTDEFEHTTWVEPKSKPKHRNANAVYMYFQKVDDKATNLRLVMQYEANDWLFIKKVIFLINGWDFTYSVNFERDNAGGRIWEWTDMGANDPVLIAALENADTVKIRYEGRQYSKDIELSKKQIQSIKDVIEYYQLLGGNIK